jgi:hypothetical protein
MSHSDRRANLPNNIGSIIMFHSREQGRIFGIMHQRLDRSFQDAGDRQQGSHPNPLQLHSPQTVNVFNGFFIHHKSRICRAANGARGFCAQRSVRLSDGLSGNGGADKTPAPLSRHFWKRAAFASGRAAVRWSQCWAAKVYSSKNFFSEVSIIPQLFSECSRSCSV